MDEAMISGAKPRVRVQAGSQYVAPPIMQPTRPSVRGGYLRDTRSGVISTRFTPLTDSRDEIRRSWRRVAGLAQDIVRNSGRLSGAVNQIVSDVLGPELQLNPKPDLAVLARLGYETAEVTQLISLIKTEWKYWCWNARECDFRGKFTIPQAMEIGLRDQIIFGEATGFVDWMPTGQRLKYGLKSSTKVCLLPPSFLVQDTLEHDRMIQGVLHDANWRPTAYRFREEGDLFLRTKDWPAFDGVGNPKVIHVFEPQGARDVRGISPIAAAIRKHIQHEMLEDATLQMAVLQTALAISLTSEAPSQDAFEALAALKDVGGHVAPKLAEEFLGMYAGQIGRARESSLYFGSDPNISHLGPGEQLNVHGVEAPGPQYDAFEKSLSRDMARALGVTYESLTLDNRGATYSSSRVGISSIWPVVIRRRERIAGPIGDVIYANWLDEMIFTGRIPFRGGYAAFAANRDRLLWTQWRGPAKPSADDKKSADAASKRIESYTSTVEIEAAELGHDADELRSRQEEEHNWYLARGMTSPYERRGSTQGPSAEPREAEDEDGTQR